MAAVPATVPVAVKSVLAVVPTAVKTGPAAVSNAVPVELKKVILAAVWAAVTSVAPAAGRAMTSVPVWDEQLTKDTMEGQDTEQPQDTQAAVFLLGREPLTMFLLESAELWMNLI